MAYHELKIFEKYEPEIVFHLAAQPLVRKSYLHPLETFEVNVMGTANVLEAVRNTRCVRVAVMVTSDKCYENKEWVWGYRESDPVGGDDPYSASKGCAELITSAYRNSFFQGVQMPTAIASVRAGNVIGGGDWAEDRLIPDMIRGIMAGEKIAIRNPQSIRPWQHVLGPIEGYMMLAKRLWEDAPSYSEAWNFGPSDTEVMTVAEIANLVRDCWESDVSWDISSGPHPHEAHYLRLDSSKANLRLGWKPKLPVKEAIRWTMDWYKAYMQKQNMLEFTRDQIEQYERM